MKREKPRNKVSKMIKKEMEREKKERIMER